MDKNSYVANVDPSIAGKLKEELLARGFELTVPPHTCFSGKKKGVSCTLYLSGKLVVQGKEKAEFIEFFLEPEILGQFTYTEQKIVSVNPAARIGIDESGKGDLFGPLCIAGLYASGDEVAKLQALGVCDSKKLNDSAIRKIAKKLRENYKHHVVRINPAKYNTLYEQFRNLNHLLAWGHATAIEALVASTGCRDVIIDQFAAEHVVITALKRKKMEVSLTQRTRAEEDLVVAGASILARDAFLHGLELLEEQFGLPLPKGASAKTVAAARQFAQRVGKESLGAVAKLHFKSLDGIRE